MIDESKPFVGYVHVLPRLFEVRLISQESYGPKAQVLGVHYVESHARQACVALNEVTAIQNAGQLHSSGLRPMPLPWVAKSA